MCPMSAGKRAWIRCCLTASKHKAKAIKSGKVVVAGEGGYHAMHLAGFNNGVTAFAAVILIAVIYKIVKGDW